MHVALNSRSSLELQSIPNRLDAMGRTQSTSVAVRCGDFAQTYGELHEFALRGAHRLVQLGCEPGHRVAILAENHPLFIAAFASIVRLGASAVTLPTMVPPSNIAEMLVDSNARVLITTPLMRVAAEAALASISAIRPAIIELKSIDEADAGLFSPVTTPSGDVQIQMESEFNIVYSSGTTGRPKGIVHSHRTRATLAAGFEGLGFDHSATTVVSTPLYTNMSIPAFLGTLWGGGTVEVVGKFDARSYLELAARVRATHFFLVPTQVSRLLAQSDLESFNLESTRLKYVAGSKLPTQAKREMLSRWPGELVEVYGMTEGAPFTVLFASRHPNKLDSVGYAPTGSDIKIVDNEDCELTIGQTGEIVGRSGSMMIGYNNRPEETSALIWRDAEGNPYFRSGDIGRFDSDGFLYIVDRKKDVIISGGYNIYGSDLEDVLLQHTDVEEAAVVGVESREWGESPVAFVVLKSESTVSAEALRSWVNGKVGKFSRIIQVVFRADLPRNALGKVLKRTLREDYGALS